MKLMGHSSGVVGVACVMALISSAQASVVIFVDAANCPGPGSGTVGDPYCSIQTAIDNAVNTDFIAVFPGTYPENIDFLGKAITLASTGGPEVTTLFGANCFTTEGPDTVLNGFTITPFGMSNGGGGGGASPTVTNCTFSGGVVGMHNSSFSSPTVTNCTFSDQLFDGMLNVDGSSPIVTDCTFSQNGGSGMRIDSPAIASVERCTFIQNNASGIWQTIGFSLVVTDCTFLGNIAGEMGPRGGGMRIEGSPPLSAVVINCTFIGNTASSTGGGFTSVRLARGR